VRRVNAAYGRTGTLWEGRYRAVLVDSEAYFLACSRYIELNPVRAAMTAHPHDYPWSSYQVHALGAPDPLAVAYPIYEALGATPCERLREYTALFDAPLDTTFVDRLRAGTNGGRAFGDEGFERRIAEALGRRITPRPAGRPANKRAGERQIL
jgi:putative transposase